MKLKSTSKIILVIIKIIAVVFISLSVLRSQDVTPFPAIPEIVPYRLIPTHDPTCPFEIEIIHPIYMNGMVPQLAYETEEILKERVVFEETNPYAINEIFTIDDKPYYLIKLPLTGLNGWRYD